MPRGGKRKGSGRKKGSNVKYWLTVKKSTAAKLERMRKATHLWKRPGQIVDELVKKAEFAGEKEIYRLVSS